MRETKALNAVITGEREYGSPLCELREKENGPAITYKCPNCDGGLVFDPSSQKYHCEYCLSDFTQEELECLSQELVRRKAEHQEPGLQGQDSREQERREPGSAGAQPVLYTCPSCGAQIVTDETTAATFCYYCHNPVVLAGRLEGQFRPDYVIPFQIDRQKAEEIFSQWIGRKKYVPETFYNKKQIESMSGVYFPYWLYSCRVDGELDAQGTRLRTWDTAGMRYTETTVYDVKRQGTMEVDHVARNGLRKANRQLVDSVLPYRMNEKEDFSMGYLSGFLAENRDMEKEQFVLDVQTEVRQFALQSLQDQAGSYSSMQVRKKEAGIRDEKWSYALLPVWTLTYNDKARGKIYYFALNGQTGKICGKLPVDRKKIIILFFSVFLPLFLLLMTGGYFLG